MPLYLLVANGKMWMCVYMRIADVEMGIFWEKFCRGNIDYSKENLKTHTGIPSPSLPYPPLPSLPLPLPLPSLPISPFP